MIYNIALRGRHWTTLSCLKIDLSATELVTLVFIQDGAGYGGANKILWACVVLLVSYREPINTEY